MRKVYKTHDDLHDRRRRRRKPDIEKRDRHDPARDKGDGNTHQEGADQSLRHNKFRLLHAAEKADKTENAGEIRPLYL